MGRDVDESGFACKVEGLYVTCAPECKKNRMLWALGISGIIQIAFAKEKIMDEAEILFHFYQNYFITIAQNCITVVKIFTVWLTIYTKAYCTTGRGPYDGSK